MTGPARRGCGALALASLLAACGSPEVGIAERVAESAESHGCTPLGAAAGQAHDVGGWFVELRPYTGGNGDVAFLCRSGGETPELLLVVDAPSPKSPWRLCPPHVPLPGAFEPGELAVVTPAESPELAGTALDGWHDASGPGPPGVFPTGPLLDTTGGVAGWAFYCHEGRWLRAFLH